MVTLSEQIECLLKIIFLLTQQSVPFNIEPPFSGGMYNESIKLLGKKNYSCHFLDDQFDGLFQ